MRILIVDGSPRKNGITNHYLSLMHDQLKTFHDVVYFRVYEKKARPCIGCLKCRPNKECVLPRDDAHEFAQLVKESDLLIIGSPTYWGNMTSVLRMFFERCVPVFEYIDGMRIRPQLTGKKAIVLVNSAAPFPFHYLPSQSAGTVSAICHILKASGIQIHRVINIPNGGKGNKATIEKKVFSAIKKFV